MPRGKRGKPVHGMVLLDKPAGLSSNQALQQVRRLFDAAKAGHTGNLDPFATGMLPLCFGEATKTAAFMLDADKSYLATAKLGVSTVTGDTEGETRTQMPLPKLSQAEAEKVLAGFAGEIQQVPPMYSALKHEGQALYKLARQGRVVERQPRRVTIHEIELVGWAADEFVFRVRCSKGTYVRTLAEDIAAEMDSCAHLVALRRLSVSPFSERHMVTMETLEESSKKGILINHLLALDAGLSGWPSVTLESPDADRFVHGNPVSLEFAGRGDVRVFGPGEKLLGLGKYQDTERLEPRRVFNLEGGLIGRALPATLPPGAGESIEK
ncbi:MAG: tRNA pseudouridine(55) synthase TruB [Xanthomonadales bacterium]|nr:tRNA pseudouridine(55) synthase TruB [Xanthomonadales bacterium]NNL94035.1 tRNA pseudouridine(55) synthase TruB [Xanthomonadales bacterium]